MKIEHLEIEVLNFLFIGRDLTIFALIYYFIEMETISRTKIKELLKMQPGQDVLAKGWVRTKEVTNKSSS